MTLWGEGEEPAERFIIEDWFEIAGMFVIAILVIYAWLIGG